MKKLEERILDALEKQPNKIASDWTIALQLYPDMRYGASPSNGARISNIRRVCQKSNCIDQCDDRSFALSR